MKKLNKFFAVLVALAMMATLCVSMAFAADEQLGYNVEPGNNKSADAVIGKYLKVPAGVNVPDETFTFTFTPKASDTNNGVAALVPAPTLNTKIEAEMKATAKGNDGNSVAGTINIADLVTYKEAGDGHAVGDLVFTDPGEYIYEVAETSNKNGAFTTTEDGITTTETFTNDTTKKIVRIYVKYDASGKLVIDTITITDGTGAKANPEQNPQTDTTYTPSSDGSGNTFVNNYEKKVTVPEPIIIKDNAPLEISKAVTAPEGYVAKDQAYPFTITLTKDANDTTTGAKVNAYIIGKDANGNTTKTLKEVNVNSATTFELKNGEVLAFSELPYGMTYTVEELLQNSSVENWANYTATVVASDNKTDGVKGGANATANGLVDEAAQDKVDVTNTLVASDVTPTGILINNLPYIALALVAIGGLVAYVVVRRRQSDEA